MITTIKNTVQELIDVLAQLNTQEYIRPEISLSNATIGQHTRHIIELFQCLINEYSLGTVNYDKRKRNKEIENNLSVAVTALQEIQNDINQSNKEIVVHYELAGEEVIIQSNYYRELMYNLEHCIHHQALIKVALLNMPHIRINDTFGVAPSTIKHRNLEIQLGS
ncbi:MAG: hypothetical protein MUC49_18920 [Raineya sp.]|jgi:uncharacterized damage-inducible protein DinB|nr:hypothetical protein [Raineya sp.]